MTKSPNFYLELSFVSILFNVGNDIAVRLLKVLMKSLKTSRTIQKWIFPLRPGFNARFATQNGRLQIVFSPITFGQKQMKLTE